MVTTIRQAQALLVRVANELSAEDEQSDLAADIAEVVTRLDQIIDEIVEHDAIKGQLT